jgi:hypothetical protein
MSILQEKENDMDLDMSWWLEQERMVSMNQIILREKMTSIPMVFVYINQHDVIDSVRKEVFDISTIDMLTKEQLYHISQNKTKQTPHSKYIYKEMMWFHIDIEPENIPFFLKQTSLDYKPFYQLYSVFENIILNPSIFIFHRMNTLFFFFYEIPYKDFVQLPSILIKCDRSKQRTTKKELTIQNYPGSKNRHTRKNNF